MKPDCTQSAKRQSNPREDLEFFYGAAGSTVITVLDSVKATQAVALLKQALVIYEAEAAIERERLRATALSKLTADEIEVLREGWVKC